MDIGQYIRNVSRRYKQGYATEHTFRGDLQQLIESIVPDIRATNEPKRQSCGAPDYILTKRDIPVGFIEAKDIGDKDLSGSKKNGNKEQFDRYKLSLTNILFTDYLDFHLYRDAQLITRVSIGKLENDSITPLPENFEVFTNLIKDFSEHIGQNIKSSKRLAEMMAAKARMLSNIIEKALSSDESNDENSTLKDQMRAFKQILIHDITPKGFADVYAQTIAYGLFAARLHDPSLQTFSRAEAAELIPKSNPFLRKLFGYIAGPDLDDRIKWIVDSLIEVFLACNVEELLKNFGKTTKTEDPIIHFYETFLSEYDPKLRKARGVWYTPQPVVNFIVRAVDDILKNDFGLPQGIADTSKTKIKVAVQATDKRFKDNVRTIEESVHRVQILDPATGTGTFLAEVVRQIHNRFLGQHGIWNNYVESHLLPRMNGFELLMASYAMAHLKLDLLLTETGYRPKTNQRFRIYLANSLEEHHQDTGTLFANWLSEEANEANRVKRDTPVMCVIGNPPYSVSSSNKGPWIESLTSDYKRDLKERNIQPLSDDYIKFIRFGQHFIDKNASGILAYISNNSFLDGLIHRQMRKHLLESFDTVYIIDLHGSTKKNETALDGSKDENVFDIQQGVSINIFIKTGKKKKGELGEVFHFDIYGKRENKYNLLDNSSLNGLAFTKLDINAPNYFFTNKIFNGGARYEEGFKLDILFLTNASGIKTERDSLTIQFDEERLQIIERDISILPIEEFRQHYTPKPDGRDWKVSTAKEDILKNKKYYIDVLYRPFDFRKTIYTGKTKGFISYPRNDVMRHLVNKNNIALLSCRQQSTFNFQHVLVTRNVADMCSVSLQTKETGYVFPLYLYLENELQQSFDSQPERVPNLSSEIVMTIEEKINLKFVHSENKINSELKNTDEAETFTPEDLFDYIYAVLHSPTFRETYKEFLKIDFPRIPYPSDATNFWKLVEKGTELRNLHLLESSVVGNSISQYPVNGDNQVTKVIFEENYEVISNGIVTLLDPVYRMGRVYINDIQYFELVPKSVWDFYIGGYQPAQKWLKDRKGRILDFDDIIHYQKVIVALFETERLMAEIDQIQIDSSL